MRKGELSLGIVGHTLSVLAGHTRRALKGSSSRSPGESERLGLRFSCSEPCLLDVSSLCSPSPPHLVELDPASSALIPPDDRLEAVLGGLSGVSGDSLTEEETMIFDSLPLLRSGSGVVSLLCFNRDLLIPAMTLPLWFWWRGSGGGGVARPPPLTPPGRANFEAALFFSFFFTLRFFLGSLTLTSTNTDVCTRRFLAVRKGTAHSALKKNLPLR